MKAVITGATSGIGESFADLLYKCGWELILTGRNLDKLAELKERYGDKAEVFEADLTDRKEVLDFYDFCKDKNSDLFINNAGFGVFGDFCESPLEKELELIDVNITAAHILMKKFLREYSRKNKGTILNVASSAGFLPGPLMSSYYASKSYIVQMTYAINEELRRKKSRVKICALCPGPVNTNFNKRAGVNFSVKPLSPEYVAYYSLARAAEGRLIIIPGTELKLGLAAVRFIPKRLASFFAYELQKMKM